MQHSKFIRQLFAAAVVTVQLAMPIAPVIAQADFTPPPADETPVVEQVVADTSTPTDVVAPAQEQVAADSSSEVTTPTEPATSDEKAAPVEESVTTTEPTADESITTDEAPITTVGDVVASGEVKVDEVSAPQLTTDKADYAPTDVVTIFGKFFKSLYTLVLNIFGGFPDGSEQVTHTDSVTTDANGDFTYQYQLDGLFRPDYTVTASDATNGEILAQTSFTDAVQTDFSQCSNNNPTAGSCNWIGSIIQSSNSVYYEGMTVP